MTAYSYYTYFKNQMKNYQANEVCAKNTHASILCTLSWILCDQLLTHFGLQEIVVNGVNAKKFELRGFPFT